MFCSIDKPNPLTAKDNRSFFTRGIDTIKDFTSKAAKVILKESKFFAQLTYALVKGITSALAVFAMLSLLALISIPIVTTLYVDTEINEYKLNKRQQQLDKIEEKIKKLEDAVQKEPLKSSDSVQSLLSSMANVDQDQAKIDEENKIAERELYNTKILNNARIKLDELRGEEQKLQAEITNLKQLIQKQKRLHLFPNEETPAFSANS